MPDIYLRIYVCVHVQRLFSKLFTPLLKARKNDSLRSQNICRGKSGLPLNAKQLLSSVIFEEFMRVIKFTKIEGK